MTLEDDVPCAVAACCGALQPDDERSSVTPSQRHQALRQMQQLISASQCGLRDTDAVPAAQPACPTADEFTRPDCSVTVVGPQRCSHSSIRADAAFLLLFLRWASYDASKAAQRYLVGARMPALHGALQHQHGAHRCCLAHTRGPAQAMQAFVRQHALAFDCLAHGLPAHEFAGIHEQVRACVCVSMGAAGHSTRPVGSALLALACRAGCACLGGGPRPASTSSRWRPPASTAAAAPMRRAPSQLQPSPGTSINSSRRRTPKSTAGLSQHLLNMTSRRASARPLSGTAAATAAAGGVPHTHLHQTTHSRKRLITGGAAGGAPLSPVPRPRRNRTTTSSRESRSNFHLKTSRSAAGGGAPRTGRTWTKRLPPRLEASRRAGQGKITTERRRQEGSTRAHVAARW